jgi:uncharacterized protein YhaN
VTSAELLPLVEQYRAGLDAELMLLHRLQAIAVDQRRASETGTATEMQATLDHRDRVMATLVTVEHELKGVRQQLLMFRQYLSDMPAFQEIAALHRQAADLVADIVAVDEDSVQALKNAEQARHLAAQTLEQGESTLAAYRRVVKPTLASATLVNRRG